MADVLASSEPTGVSVVRYDGPKRDDYQIRTRFQINVHDGNASGLPKHITLSYEEFRALCRMVRNSPLDCTPDQAGYMEGCRCGNGKAHASHIVNRAAQVIKGRKE